MSTGSGGRAGNYIETELVEKIDAISITHVPRPTSFAMGLAVLHRLANLAGRIEGERKHGSSAATIEKLEYEFACFKHLHAIMNRISANEESFKRWFMAHKPLRPPAPPKEEEGDAA